jgi:hypothetical protein
MLVVWTLGVLTLLLALTLGLTLLKTGRDLQVGRRSARKPKVAVLVDNQLVRARTAVEVLIQPEVEASDVRPRSSASHRGQTYAVMGIGLLGLGVVAGIGLLLLGG